PQAFERRPACRGDVVFGERAGIFFRSEPRVNSNRVPVNSRNSRRVWRARAQANRDDRGQDRCDLLQHGAILLMTRSGEATGGSGGGDARGEPCRPPGVAVGASSGSRVRSWLPAPFTRVTSGSGGRGA